MFNKWTRKVMESINVVVKDVEDPLAEVSVEDEDPGVNMSNGFDVASRPKTCYVEDDPTDDEVG